MSKPTGKLIRVTTASIGAVPVGRKVNNKPLSADVSLSAGDVGAYSKTESDNKYQLKGNYAPTGNYAVKGESYTKTESDGRYQPKGSYQPTGNYALKGDSYTKAESYNRTDIDKKIGAGSGLGYGQDWEDVKSQRKHGVVYTNTTNKPIMISVFTNADSTLTIDVRKNSAAPWVTVGADSARGAVPNNLIIPTNYQYRVNSYFGYWAELK